MFYYKLVDGKLFKYNVLFNKDKIEKLKDEIIDNCSFIKHVELDSDYGPYFSDYRYVRNYRYYDTGKDMEYFEETRSIYHYSYDLLEPTKLVNLINALLNGNSEAIDEIMNYRIYKTSKIDRDIKAKNKEFANLLASNNIKKKKEVLKELEELIKLKDLNKNQVSEEEYYKQLLNLIKFDLVDKVNLGDVYRMERFFNTEFIRINYNKNKTKSHVKSLIKRKDERNEK